MSTAADLLEHEHGRRTERRSGERLLERAISCRAAALAARSGGTDDPLALLAAELAYDRALTRLCVEEGIELGGADAGSRGTSRRYLECELYRRGVDLHAAARAPRS